MLVANENSAAIKLNGSDDEGEETAFPGLRESKKWAHIFNPLFGGNDVLAGWRSALSMFIAVASPLGFITKIYEEPGSLKCLLYRRRVKVDEELRPLPTSWKRSFL